MSVVVVPSAPGTPEATAVVRAYFADIVGRWYARPATDGEIDAAMGDDPSVDLVPPFGLLLLSRVGATVTGCAGLRFPGVDVGEGVGEVKRVFVAPAHRGRGHARLLLDAVERHARERGARCLRLDVRDDLREARGLYAASGYRSVPAFNTNPYAGHWLEKRLGR